ncbi:MAG: SDR family oxidoreductase [Desulfobacteraceae bacterium]|jgi:3-oxoacyl-[acyl-carrier protein] reductase|nr:SDR family oxidoreductase [Desulfobacteraceae bacterium]
MQMGLEEKTVLVMAASSGMGRATAVAFAAEGARVMLFARSEDKLAAACEEMKNSGAARVGYVVGDLTRAEDVQRAVSETADRFGPPWALVNNCGGPPAGPFESFDDDAWQAAFSLTLLAYVRSIRSILPHMKSAGGGRIVNFTSSSTRQAIDNLILSNSFRMGVVGLSKSLARELGPYGILVNVLGPGKIETERLMELSGIWAEKAGVSPEVFREESEKVIPLGRFGSPDEMARTAVFLCSAANTYITGQTILVDGAATLAY